MGSGGGNLLFHFRNNYKAALDSHVFEAIYLKNAFIALRNVHLFVVGSKSVDVGWGAGL